MSNALPLTKHLSIFFFIEAHQVAQVLQCFFFFFNYTNGMV